jgi:hypothetical protein
LLALTGFNYVMKTLSFEITGVGFDGSWMWAINHVPFLSDVLYGRDTAFTYGPLGFLNVGTYYTGTIAASAISYLLLTALLMLLIWLLHKKEQISLTRLFYFSVAVCLVSGTAPIDWIWNIVLFALACTIYTLYRHRSVFVGLTLLLGALIALTLLVKFSNAVYGIALSAMLSLAFLLKDRKALVSYIMYFLMTFIPLILLSALIIFDGLSNFIVWLQMSFEIANGYNAKGGGDSGEYAIYILLMFPLLALFAATFVCAFKHRATDNSSFGLLLLAVVPLFFSYKHTIVQQSFPFFPSFYTTAVFVCGICFLLAKTELYKLSKALLVYSSVIAFMLVSILSLSNPRLSIFSGLIKARDLPTNYANYAQQKINDGTNFILPQEWNDLISDRAIHIIGQLAYAEANRWSGWIPTMFPIFTKRLDEHLAAMFVQERAAEYILLTDIFGLGMHGFLTAPASWSAIASNYYAVKNTDKEILLTKKQLWTTLSFEHILTQTAHFNEIITLPTNGELYAKITVKPSLIGRAITTFYRGYPPTITIVFQDNSKVDYTVYISNMHNPVRIDSLPRTTSELLSLFLDQNTSGIIKSIKFSSQKQYMFDDEINIEWLAPDRSRL